MLAMGFPPQDLEVYPGRLSDVDDSAEKDGGSTPGRGSLTQEYSGPLPREERQGSASEGAHLAMLPAPAVPARDMSTQPSPSLPGHPTQEEQLT